MQTSIYFLALLATEAPCSSFCIFLGFVILLGLLAAVLKWGPPYLNPSIVSADSPRFRATSPFFAEKRRRAAAAALALHHHHSSTGSSL
jgi:hypothetical protein